MFFGTQISSVSVPHNSRRIKLGRFDSRLHSNESRLIMCEEYVRVVTAVTLGSKHESPFDIIARIYVTIK